jgi:hypothetical protein
LLGSEDIDVSAKTGPFQTNQDALVTLPTTTKATKIRKIQAQRGKDTY